MRTVFFTSVFLTMLFAISTLCIGFGVVFAQSTTDPDKLKSTIQSHESIIQKLTQEIAQFQKDLSIVASKKATLTNTISELDLSRKKANSSILLTKEKIESTEKRIGTLTEQIAEKNASIQLSNLAASAAVKNVYLEEDRSMLEVLAAGDSLSTMWDSIEQLQTLESTLQDHVDTLQVEKEVISSLKAENEKQTQTLKEEQQSYIAHKQELDAAKEEKARILKETKNQEAEFQRILAEKKKAKTEFESQLRDYESQLKFVLDKSTIPISGKGVLSWPLDTVTISQRFGNTAFAQGGAYNGKGHNGVDFATSTGTPVKAALSGVVMGTGNTDTIRGCYSYGRWILIKHNNGLATLYAHLSKVHVTTGDQVTTRQVIGNSGNTGYSTGPHLHFSVFAAEAVKVAQLSEMRTGTPCANAYLPVSAWSGYLNPLDYL